MKRIGPDTYQALRHGAQVLEQDEHGEKVLVLKDGAFLKLFRVKRLFSSARLRPHAFRFARNARALHRLGIPTVEVLEVLRIPPIKRTAVQYQPLEGRTLRDLVADGNTFLRPTWTHWPSSWSASTSTASTSIPSTWATCSNWRTAAWGSSTSPT